MLLKGASLLFAIQRVAKSRLAPFDLATHQVARSRQAPFG
jgi:hypothetical protein